MKKILFLFLSLTAFVFAAININTASLEELKSLKGIGEVKAKAILEYRKEANFTSIDDIKKVKGINQKLFEKIKNDISIDSETKRDFKSF